MSFDTRTAAEAFAGRTHSSPSEYVAALRALLDRAVAAGREGALREAAKRARSVAGNARLPESMDPQNERRVLLRLAESLDAIASLTPSAEPERGQSLGTATVPAADHAGARAGGEGLTFSVFAKANRERCEAPRAAGGFGRTLPSMSVEAMALAAAGEMGEICDGIYNWVHNPRKGIADTDVIDEIGDTAAYLDLLAQRLGSSLADAIVRKWNRVSEKRGYPARIGAPASPSPAEAPTPELLSDGHRGPCSDECVMSHREATKTPGPSESPAAIEPALSQAHDSPAPGLGTTAPTPGKGGT